MDGEKKRKLIPLERKKRTHISNSSLRFRPRLSLSPSFPFSAQGRWRKFIVAIKFISLSSSLLLRAILLPQFIFRSFENSLYIYLVSSSVCVGCLVLYNSKITFIAIHAKSLTHLRISRFIKCDRGWIYICSFPPKRERDHKHRAVLKIRRVKSSLRWLTLYDPSRMRSLIRYNEIGKFYWWIFGCFTISLTSPPPTSQQQAAGRNWLELKKSGK